MMRLHCDKCDAVRIHSLTWQVVNTPPRTPEEYLFDYF